MDIRPAMAEVVIATRRCVPRLLQLPRALHVRAQVVDNRPHKQHLRAAEVVARNKPKVRVVPLETVEALQALRQATAAEVEPPAPRPTAASPSRNLTTGAAERPATRERLKLRVALLETVAALEVKPQAPRPKLAAPVAIAVVQEEKTTKERPRKLS